MVNKQISEIAEFLLKRNLALKVCVRVKANHLNPKSKDLGGERGGQEYLAVRESKPIWVCDDF